MTSSVSSSTSTNAPAAPVVSIAGSNSAAAAGGSVINVNELVSELVAAAQGPQEALISNQTEAVTAQISALGTLQSALSTFQSSLGALDTPGAFNAVSASSSDPTMVAASAGPGAAVGSYNVVVSRLAQAEQLLSTNAFGSGSSTVGTGSLSLSLGGTSFDVTINSGNDSLDGIAAAINAASGNPGISAAVLTGTGGAYLLLTSTVTGAANTIQVSETDGGQGLAALTYSAASPSNYALQGSGPQDASYSISGVSATSPTNTISGALPGVTLNLLDTTGVDGVTLTVSNDAATIAANVQSFVSAYNTLLGTFQSVGGYDAAAQTAGSLMGNGVLQAIQSQTNEALYSIVSTGSPVYNTLASIGITTNGDGTLRLNSSTLSSALASNQAAVSKLFSSTGGVAARLNSQISAALSSSGSLTQLDQSLTARENALTQQSNALDQRMATLTASLTQQYAALNTLLSSLQTTSAYLTQAFANLPLVQSKSNS